MTVQAASAHFFTASASSATTVVLGTVLIALATWLVVRRFIRPKGRLPPGPIGFPLIGVSAFLGKHPQIAITKWAEKYNSNIISMYLGPYFTVVLNDYEAIKAAYVDQADVFSGRPQNFVAKYLSRGDHGIILSEGTFWRDQRRFLMRSFHDLGVGKSRFEELCLEEVQVLVQSILAHGPNAPFNPREEIDSSVANIICALVFAKRFERRDPTLRAFLDNQYLVGRVLSQTNALQVLPFLRHIPPFRAKWKEFQNIVDRYLMDIIEPEVRRIEKQYDPSQEPTSVTEFFLQRRAKQFGTTSGANAQVESDKFVQDINVIVNVQIVFTAGTETSITTLTWCILFLVLYPEEQQRCYKNIIDCVGSDRPVTWDDRTSLPYVEAFLLEVWRRANVVPLGVVRRNTEDAYLNGYFIPKHTFILPNMWNVHRSEKYWEDSQKFNPSRFVDSGGKVLRPVSNIPFSTGKRQCTGEGIARMEIFLLLANLIQKVEFVRAADGSAGGLEQLPDVDNFITGVTVQPGRQFKICAKAR